MREVTIFEFISTTNPTFNCLQGRYVVLTRKKNNDYLRIWEYSPELENVAENLIIKCETSSVVSEDYNNNMLIVNTRHSVYYFKTVDKIIIYNDYEERMSHKQCLQQVYNS